MQTSESLNKEWRPTKGELDYIRSRFERQRARAKEEKCRDGLMALLRNSKLYDQTGPRRPEGFLPDELTGTDFFQKS